MAAHRGFLAAAEESASLSSNALSSSPDSVSDPLPNASPLQVGLDSWSFKHIMNKLDEYAARKQWQAGMCVCVCVCVYVAWPPERIVDSVYV